MEISPYYGKCLDFNNHRVMQLVVVHSNQAEVKVLTFINESGIQDWVVFRESGEIVDVDKIQNAQIYSRSHIITL